jgi:hypothetical protein
MHAHRPAADTQTQQPHLGAAVGQPQPQRGQVGADRAQLLLQLRRLPLQRLRPLLLLVRCVRWRAWQRTAPCHGLPITAVDAQ